MTYQASPDDTPRLREADEPSLAAGTPALEVTHLRKSYGPVVAVDDVSFSAAEGEIVGVQLQDSAFPAELSVGAILDVYRSVYRSPELFKDVNTGAASHEE